MIWIYSAEPDTGKLFTDPHQHYYIDAEILREHATRSREKYLLNRIAIEVGYNNYGELDTNARCNGVTPDILRWWIITGKLKNWLDLKAQS